MKRFEVIIETLEIMKVGTCQIDNPMNIKQQFHPKMKSKNKKHQTTLFNRKFRRLKLGYIDIKA